MSHRYLSVNLVGLLLAVVLLSLAGYTYFSYAADDAFISYRYARHLAEGEGLVWNPGENLESYSNFLWVLILAVVHLVGLNIVPTSMVLSIVSGIALLIVVYWLARDVSDEYPVSPLWIAPVVLTLNRDILFWNPSGMETTFFAFLVVAAAWRYLAEVRSPHKFPLSSLLFFLVAITRPEGIVCFLATIAFDLLYQRRMRWRALWICLIPFGIYQIWRVIYFGDFLPCPYYAKVGGDQRFVLGAQYVGVYAFETLPIFAALSLLVLFPPKNPGRVFYLFWLVLAGIAAAFWMDGDWMGNSRLMIPATALLAAMLVPSVSGLLAARTASDRRASWVVLLLAGLVIFQSVGVTGRDLIRIVTLTQQPMAECLEGEMTMAMKAAGLWLRDHSDPDDLIAVNHAGALPYYAERPAVDMTGLCDRHISRVPGGRHEKYDVEYILARDPRYVVLNTTTKPINGSYGRDYWIGETELYDHPLFLERYRPLPNFYRWRWEAIEAKITYTMIFERIAPSPS
ncbi:MAG: hypothetical protein ABIH23_26060 [bacterium]